MRLLKTIFSDFVFFFNSIYSYLYWNSKGVRITMSCSISTKAKIGKGCVFTGNTIITDKAEIGIYTYGYNLNIHNAIIGDFCSLAPDVKVGLDEHPMNEKSTHPHFYQEINQKKVIIENHVWLGTNSVILCGVKIGKHAVIGAGSIVNKDIEDFTLNVGVPCKLVKHLPKENKI
ncbi:acyltransferase [Flavobacterium sp. LB1P62]|uniref:acyltransferase n=1 Tax=Flavobacterium sp. LB1P62 TaxID=3401715 RepID=UPI003AADF4AD